MSFYAEVVNYYNVIYTSDPSVITNDNINMLTCDDFDAPALASRTVSKSRNTIGFINC